MVPNIVQAKSSGFKLSIYRTMHTNSYMQKVNQIVEASRNIYLDGFSMKSNPRISSKPRALSCKMTLERLHRLISGFVESSSFSNSLSG